MILEFFNLGDVKDFAQSAASLMAKKVSATTHHQKKNERDTQAENL